MDGCSLSLVLRSLRCCLLIESATMADDMHSIACSCLSPECSGGSGFSFYSPDLNDITASVDGIFNSDLPGGLYHPMDIDNLVIQVR